MEKQFGTPCYEMIVRLATGQQTFRFVKAIRWSSIEMGISRIYIFLSRRLIRFSCVDVTEKTRWVDGRYVQPQFPTALKMWWVCGWVLPLRMSLDFGEVSTNSSLTTLRHDYCARGRNSPKHLNLHKTASGALAVWKNHNSVFSIGRFICFHLAALV